MALKFLNNGYFAGKVGIGTESPTDRLHVNQGSDAFRGITIEGTTPALYLKDTQATNAYHIAANGNYLYFLEDSNQSGSYNNIMGYWDPSNNFILPNSKVGIGTTSATQKLHVSGNLRVTGAYYDSNNAPGTLDQVLTSTVTGVAWVDPGTITAEAATLVVIECKNTSGTTITKGTPVYQTGTVGATDVIEIAPADALISAGKQPAIGLLQTTLNNNGFGKVVITGEFLNFTTDPIDGVTPTTGDKVFLKSGGGLTLTKPTGAGNGIQNLGLIGKVSGGNAGSITVSSIMRTNDVPNLPTGKIWVGDGNTIVSDTVFLDEPNGRMGIGTTSPVTKLDVYGTSDTYLTVRNSGGGNKAGIRMYGGSAGISHIWHDDAETNPPGIHFGTSADTATTPTTQLYIKGTNGNVGIGTTSPDFKLDVDGTLGVSDLPFNTDSVSVLVADETIGAELITNGDFATNTDWTLTANVAISGEKLNFTNATTNTHYANQVISAPVGSVYKITLEVSNLGSGESIKIRYPFQDTSINANGTYTIVGEGTTANAFRITPASATATFSIDNVSVKQITSASNQIQKRELGTGAFGPTPVGAYLPLAGGTMTGNLKLNDNVQLQVGSSADLQILHASNSFLTNNTGDLYLRNLADDKDIIFQSDDGAGGVATYFYLDGSLGLNRFLKDTLHNDNVVAKFGTGSDLRIQHSSGNNSSYIQNYTGDLVIENLADDKDIIFKSDDGSGGTTPYLTLDSSITKMIASKDIHFDGTVKATFGSNATPASIYYNGNEDVDTGTETVASVVIATHTAAFFDFVIKKTTNVRSGTVYACHDGTNVEFTETSTQDLGDTSDVTLSVDISGGNMRLLATVTSDDWSIKSLIRAI